jgi:hypothetical protein
MHLSGDRCSEKEQTRKGATPRKEQTRPTHFIILLTLYIDFSGIREQTHLPLIKESIYESIYL